MENSKILETIDNLIYTFSKNKDHDNLVAIRNIKSDFIYESEKSSKTADQILAKLYKVREDTSKLYKDINKNLYENEVREMKLLQPLLPEEISEEDIITYFDTLPIKHSKMCFKLFQDAALKKFGRTIDSQIILTYITKG